jgi:hypothetical protein
MQWLMPPDKRALQPDEGLVDLLLPLVALRHETAALSGSCGNTHNRSAWFQSKLLPVCFYLTNKDRSVQ